MNQKIKDNSRYDMKSIKVRPKTYERLIKLKGKLALKEGKVHSADYIMNYLIDNTESRESGTGGNVPNNAYK